jgi:hypothetical protein
MMKFLKNLRSGFSEIAFRPKLNKTSLKGASFKYFRYASLPKIFRKHPVTDAASLFI